MKVQDWRSYTWDINRMKAEGKTLKEILEVRDYPVYVIPLDLSNTHYYSPIVCFKKFCSMYDYEPTFNEEKTNNYWPYFGYTDSLMVYPMHYDEFEFNVYAQIYRVWTKGISFLKDSFADVLQVKVEVKSGSFPNSFWGLDTIETTCYRGDNTSINNSCTLADFYVENGEIFAADASLNSNTEINFSKLNITVNGVGFPEPKTAIFNNINELGFIEKNLDGETVVHRQPTKKSLKTTRDVYYYCRMTNYTDDFYVRNISRFLRVPVNNKIKITEGSMIDTLFDIDKDYS